jgi:hypothetical protein
MIRAAGGLTNLFHVNGCSLEDLMKEVGGDVEPIIDATEGGVAEVVVACGGLVNFKKCLKDDIAEVIQVVGGLSPLIKLAGGGEEGLAQVHSPP